MDYPIGAFIDLQGVIDYIREHGVARVVGWAARCYGKKVPRQGKMHIHLRDGLWRLDWRTK